MPLYAVFWHAAHLMAGTLIMMSGSLLSLGLSSGYPLRLRLPRKWHLQPSNLTRPQATALALLTGGICLYSSRHVHLQQQSAAGHQIQCNAVQLAGPTYVSMTDTCCCNHGQTALMAWQCVTGRLCRQDPSACQVHSPRTAPGASPAPSLFCNSRGCSC